MTKETEKRFSRVYKGICHSAIVTVQLTDAVEQVGVSVRCTAPFIVMPQGYFEDVPADGFNDWKQGAALGAEYALQVAGENTHNIVISRIMGLIAETNPTAVGAAAALGVWEAVGYQPTSEQVKQFWRHVFDSWDQSFDALPNFRSAPNTPMA